MAKQPTPQDPITFEEMRRSTRKLLADALQDLLADCPQDAGPTPEQAEDLYDARQHVTKAIAALDRAGENSK